MSNGQGNTSPQRHRYISVTEAEGGWIVNADDLRQQVFTDENKLRAYVTGWLSATGEKP